MRWIALAVVLFGCKQKDPPPAPAPTPAGSNTVVVADPEIVKQADEVLHGSAEPMPASASAKSKDPAPILGEWTIREIFGSIDGKVSAPTPPIVPGSWIFGKDGAWSKTGGNELTGHYVFTGDHIIISGVGPALDYEIKKLTPKEMELTSKIDGIDITNSTRFDRKK